MWARCIREMILHMQVRMHVNITLTPFQGFHLGDVPEISGTTTAWTAAWALIKDVYTLSSSNSSNVPTVNSSSSHFHCQEDTVWPLSTTPAGGKAPVADSSSSSMRTRYADSATTTTKRNEEMSKKLVVTPSRPSKSITRQTFEVQ